MRHLLSPRALVALLVVLGLGGAAVAARAGGATRHQGGAVAPAVTAPVTFPTVPPTTQAPTTTSPPPTAAPRPTTTPADPALRAALDPILVNTQSCLEVRDAAGRVLYAHQPALALAPASTQKLLVAAAALDLLGPGYRFVTSLVATRRPVAGEVDDVWLTGGGDPVLSSPEYTAFLIGRPLNAGHPVTTQLSALVNGLVADGVHSIRDGIHGDDSRYDRTRFLPTWKAIYLQEGDVAPLGALEVDDSLDHWHPAVLTADPAAHAAGVLARLAAGAGIAAAQGSDGTAPPGGLVLAAVQSPPLADIVTSMLRDSDNVAAEMLTRELDRVAGTRAGTTAGGLAVVERDAARLGLPVTGLHLVDGSGLSPQNRASCETLIDALALSSQPRFAALGLLSVAGRFGTLVNRFQAEAGHLEAKTGSIGGAMGLVGRIDVGRPLSFSFLINGGFGYLAGAGYEDRVVAAVSAAR